MTTRQKGLAAAITVAACWSFLALLLKYALVLTDSATIVWYRMCVAFVLMVLWFIYSQRTQDLRVLKAPPGGLALAGLALGLNYFGFMKGVDFTSPANTQIFIQLGPLSLAIVGLVIFKEKLSRVQIIGFAVCLIGFGFFFQDRIDLHGKDPGPFFKGLAWIIFAALSWTLFATIQKGLLKTWKSSQINTYIYMVSSLLFIPWVNWQDLSQGSLWVHLFMIFLGLNNLIAYGALSIAIQNLPLTQVTPIITLNPLITLIMISFIEWIGWTFIPPDPISWMGYSGAILAIFGTILVLSQRRPAPSRVRL